MPKKKLPSISSNRILFPHNFKCSKCGREESNVEPYAGISISLNNDNRLSFCVHCIAIKWIEDGIGIMQTQETLGDDPLTPKE